MTFATLINYSTAPSVDQFHIATIAELESISAEIDAAESSSLQTEWSKSAWQTDREACTRALALARGGKSVLVAQDEDGYYFATERK